MYFLSLLIPFCFIINESFKSCTTAGCQGILDFTHPKWWGSPCQLACIWFISKVLCWSQLPRMPLRSDSSGGRLLAGIYIQAFYQWVFLNITPVKEWGEQDWREGGDELPWSVCSRRFGQSFMEHSHENGPQSCPHLGKGPGPLPPIPASHYMQASLGEGHSLGSGTCLSLRAMEGFSWKLLTVIMLGC